FYKPDNLKKAYELFGKSPSWALNLCLGCCSRMPGGEKNVTEMIESFAPKGKIAYSHFRDVQGTVPNFTECFIGDGNYDPAEVVALLVENNFDGFLLDDHLPKMDGDSPWSHVAAPMPSATCRASSACWSSGRSRRAPTVP
ncbi:MAG: hypothetical protein EOP18_01915, partial [Rhizobiaceae bacterium]